MPIYEYHCPRCKATYELQQSFAAESTHTCEECGKGTAKRVLHAPRVVFKGSGFYATDSKSRSTAVSDEPGSSDSGKSDNGKSDNGKSESSSTESTSSPEAAAAS